MANKKIQHEVEVKGLDPTIPHSLLGEDKRLVVPATNVASVHPGILSHSIYEEIEGTIQEPDISVLMDASEQLPAEVQENEPKLEVAAATKPKRIPPGRKPKPKPIEEG